MRWVWAIRLMVVAACAVAELEAEGVIRPPGGNLGLAILVVLLTIHFAVVVRIARKNANARTTVLAVSENRAPKSDPRKERP